MLDRDIAELYGVETKRLKEQVKRNIERFPEDFMFELSTREYENLRSHFATSSWGGTSKLTNSERIRMESFELSLKRSISCCLSKTSRKRRLGLWQRRSRRNTGRAVIGKMRETHECMGVPISTLSILSNYYS